MHAITNCTKITNCRKSGKVYAYLIGLVWLGNCVPWRALSSLFCDTAVQSAMLETKQGGQKTAGPKITCLKKKKKKKTPLCSHTVGYSHWFQIGFHMNQKRGSLDLESSGFPPHLS